MSKKLDFTRTRHRSGRNMRKVLMTTTVLTGMVFAATGANTQGFSIAVEGEHIAGDPTLVAPNAARESQPVDPVLAEANVAVSFDMIDIDKALGVSTVDGQVVFEPGAVITVVTSANFVPFISRGEVIVYDVGSASPNEAILRVDADPNSQVSFTVPSGGSGRYAYSYRVYDQENRYDETARRSLVVQSGSNLVPQNNVIASASLNHMVAESNIGVNGAVVQVRVTDLQPGDRVSAGGATAVANEAGVAIVEFVRPIGTHQVQITVQRSNGTRNYTRKITVPREDWYYIAQADLTHHTDLETNEGVTTGRVAGYLKGRFRTGERITASVDTGEGEIRSIFNNILEDTADAYLGRFDPDDAYAIYGDDSTIVEDAPTSGRIYVRIENENSYALAGNFKPDFYNSRYIRNDRAHYGLIYEVETKATTTAGDPVGELSVYSAAVNQRPSRDVFLGTGNSIYFMEHHDITPGSETVLVEVRDAQGYVVATRRLQYGIDYDFDHSQGVVLLTSPLHANVGDAFLTSTSADSQKQYLVVNYEYSPALSDVDGRASGARASWAATDKLRVGVSAKKDTTDEVDLTIATADATYQINEQSYVRAEVSSSEGSYFGENYSPDGGLTFKDGEALASPTRANAYYLEAQVDLTSVGFDNLQSGLVHGYVEKIDAGFISDHGFNASDTNRFGLATQIAFNDRLSVRAKYDHLDNATNYSTDTAKVDVIYGISDDTTLTLGAAYEDVSDPVDTANSGQKTDLAARVDHVIDDDLTLSGFAQSRVSHSGAFGEYLRYGVGLDMRINDNWRANAELSHGTEGFGGEVLAQFDAGQGDYFYLGYRLDPSRDLGQLSQTGADNGQIVMGHARRHNEEFSSYSEMSYDLLGDRRKNSQIVGLKYAPRPDATYDLSYEAANLVGTNGDDISRSAFSIGASYASDELWQGSFRLEYRIDDSENDANDKEIWGLRGKAHYRANDDWRMTISGDAMVADSNGIDLYDARYFEASVAAAYRPVDNDKVNALLHAAYFHDAPGVSALDTDDASLTKKHRGFVISADANYDLNEHFTLGGKLGMRVSESADVGTNNWTDSSIGLGVVRLDYHLNHVWDITGQYRVIWDRESKQTDSSGLVAAYYHIDENMKFGVGYDFGKFSDDARDFSENRGGVFVNAVLKF